MVKPTPAMIEALKTNIATPLIWKFTAEFEPTSMAGLTLKVTVNGEGEKLYGEWKEDYKDPRSNAKSKRGVCDKAKESKDVTKYRVKFDVNKRAASI